MIHFTIIGAKENQQRILELLFIFFKLLKLVLQLTIIFINLPINFSINLLIYKLDHGDVFKCL